MKLEVKKMGLEEVSITVSRDSGEAPLGEMSAALPLVFGFLVGMVVSIGVPFVLARFCSETIKIRLNSIAPVSIAHYNPLALLGFTAMMMVLLAVVCISWLWCRYKFMQCSAKIQQRLIEERSGYVRSALDRMFISPNVAKNDPPPMSLTISHECRNSVCHAPHSSEGNVIPRRFMGCGN